MDKTINRQALSDFIGSLTYAHLEDCSDMGTLDRANRCLSKVADMSLVNKNTLAARVRGRQTYITTVTFEAPDDVNEGEAQLKWNNECTCLVYPKPCKHGVALLLVAVQYHKNKTLIPQLAPDSELHYALDESGTLSSDRERPNEQDEEPQNQLSKLKASSHEDLVQLISGLCQTLPEASDYIDRVLVERSAQPDALVARIKSDLRYLNSLQNCYSQEDRRALDFRLSGIENCMQVLVDTGRPGIAALMSIADQFWVTAVGLTETVHDLEDLVYPARGCLAVIIDALPHSTLSHKEQIFWVLERELVDDFGLLDQLDKLPGNPSYTPADWLAVAEDLENRLDKMAASLLSQYSHATTKAMLRNSTRERYQYEQVLNRLLKIYRQAHLQDRIVPRLKTARHICDLYPRLVDELLAQNRTSEAREMCIEGHNVYTTDRSHKAGSMKERLREMAEDNNDYLFAASCALDDFYERPAVTSYLALEQAANKINRWKQVRPAIMQFLELGTDIPWDGDTRPLPATGLAPPQDPILHPGRTPHIDTLIGIALTEKQNNVAVLWFNKLPLDERMSSAMTLNLAQHVEQTHPELAIEIRKHHVEDLINEKKPTSYVAAANQLRTIQSIYQTTSQQSQWNTYFHQLRKEHKAKSRLMSILKPFTAGLLIEQ